MQCGRGFRLALYASAFLLMGTVVFCLASYQWRDEIPFGFRGVHYRVASCRGEIIIDNEPQIVLDSAPAEQRKAEVDVLVRQYREISDHFNGEAESGDSAAILQWESELILARITCKGYFCSFTPDNSFVLVRIPVLGSDVYRANYNGLIVADSAHMVWPIQTDAQGKPIVLNDAPPALPVVYSFSYVAPALFAAIFPALFVFRWLRARSRRRRKICVAHKCIDCAVALLVIADCTGCEHSGCCRGSRIGWLR